MIKRKFIFGLTFFVLIVFSLNYSNYLKSQILQFSNEIRNFFIEQSYRVNSSIQRHFRQKQQIKLLEKQVEILKPTAELSALFAAKLNQLLDESNLTAYNPKLHLSRVIAYEKLNNPFKMWLEFPSYEKNASYGLIHKDFTAGIVYPKFNKPLAHLQFDKKVVFSVLIGKDKHLGVIYGNEKNLLIKYIPSLVDINIGDEVVTSGADRLFYEGVKVGKVVDIRVKNIYKIAVVEPYMKVKKPNFLYVVDLGKPTL